MLYEAFTKPRPAGAIVVELRITLYLNTMHHNCMMHVSATQSRFRID